MQIEDNDIAKIDSSMEEALRQAQEDEEIIAIIILDFQESPLFDPVHRAQFPTDEDYRSSILESRQKAYTEQLGATFEQLRLLGLKILTGGTMTRVVTVTGTAKQILQASLLPKVLKITTDSDPVDARC